MNSNWSSGCTFPLILHHQAVRFSITRHAEIVLGIIRVFLFLLEGCLVNAEIVLGIIRVFLFLLEGCLVNLSLITPL